METIKGGGSSLRGAANRTAHRPLDLVISIDTTVSMHGVLQEMQAAIDGILLRLLRDVVELRVAIVAHGDYFDGDAAYVTKCVDFTNDGDRLSRFVKTLEGTSGGDWPECYELVLRMVHDELSWRPGTQRILIMLGDSIPHEPDYPLNIQHIDWRNEVQRLRDEMGVTVSAIQAYSDTEADFFWRHITEQAGGRLLRLGCFEELVGVMVLGLVYNSYDENQFTALEDEMLACEPNDRRCRLVCHMFDTLRYDNRHQNNMSPAYVEPKVLDLAGVRDYVSQAVNYAALTSQSDDEPPLELVLCLDTSTSMYGVTKSMRDDIEALMGRVYHEAQGVRVAVVVHGDYDSRQYSTMHIDFAQSAKPIAEFVRRTPDITDKQHWAHNNKCYELALRQIRTQLSWTPHSRRVIIMVGDSRPHEPEYRLNVDKIDWRNELVFLHQDMDVSIYSVQMHADREADSFWYDLAKATNGKHLHLGNLENIVSTIVMAIIYKEENIGAFRAYEDEILAYKGTGKRYDTLRLCFETIYNDDIDSLTSDPAAMRRHHPRTGVRVPKPDPTARPEAEDRIMEVVISIDCAISMASTLDNLQNSICDIIYRLFKDAEHLRVAIFAHTDYESDSFSTTYVDFTTDLEELTDFVHALEPMTGGHEQECYELVLREVQDKLAWSPGSQRSLIMIGDASPHDACNQLNTDSIDWRMEIDNIMYQHIRAYSIQLHSNRKADEFWTALANGTNGVRTELEMADNLVGMTIMAIVYRERGLKHLKKFEEDVKSAGAAPNDMKKVGYIFDTLRAGQGEPPAEEMHRPNPTEQKHMSTIAEEKRVPTMVTQVPSEEQMPSVPSAQSTTDEEESLAVHTRKRRGSSMASDVADMAAPAESGASSIPRGSSAFSTDSSNLSESEYAECIQIEPKPIRHPRQIEEEIVVTSTFMTPVTASPGNEFFKASPPPDEVSDMSAPEPTKSSQSKPTGGKKADKSGSKPSVKSASSKGDDKSGRRPLDVVFSFDTTLSMVGVMERVRQDIEFIATRLFKDIPDLRVAIFAHGDYDTPNYIIQCLDFTDNTQEVVRFVRGMEDTLGSHWQECYELVLQQARMNIAWRPGSKRIIIMVGDSSPHEPHYPLNTAHIDYRKEVAALTTEGNVKIYGVQVYSDKEATPFWKFISESSGGKYLDVGSSEPLVAIMLMAVVYSEYNTDILEKFASEVSSSDWAKHRDAHVRRLFETLGSMSKPAKKQAGTPKVVGSKPPKQQTRTPKVIESVPLGVPSNPSVTTVIDDGIEGEVSADRVAEVKGKKRCAKKRPASDTVKMVKIQPPDKVPRSRSPSPGSKIPREVTGDTDTLLGSLDWSEWMLLMQSAPAARGTPGWVKRVTGPGHRSVQVLSDMSMPAIYEFSVEPSGEKVKYPVYLTGTAGFQNIRLDTYFLRQEHITRQINRVIKRGCMLYVRRAIILKPSKENSAQKTKSTLMRTYDYCWSTYGRRGVHRPVILANKIMISDKIFTGRFK